eukprot:1701249-Alexandrium_andersonii.AAC.1
MEKRLRNMCRSAAEVVRRRHSWAMGLSWMQNTPLESKGDEHVPEPVTVGTKPEDYTFGYDSEFRLAYRSLNGKGPRELCDSLSHDDNAEDHDAITATWSDGMRRDMGMQRTGFG